MAEKQRKLHAIIFPLPYQGHINPSVSVALKIASKGLKVTYVLLEFAHRKLSKAHGRLSNEDLFSEARNSGLDISCLTIGDSFPPEFDRDLNFPIYWEFMFRELSARVDEFVATMIRTDPDAAYFLVVDSSYVWPASIAEKYNLVYVCFSTQAASPFCLAYHWELLREKGHLSCKDNEDVTIDYVPGVQPIMTRDIMTYLDPETVVAEAMYAAFISLRKADFILHNTVEELEPHPLLTLNHLYQPNYPVGPISFTENLPAHAIAKSLWPETDCSNWLASRAVGSVLYVSFGSLVETNEHVIREIAHGLLLSGVNFIWVVREGILGSSDATSVLPVGFGTKIEDKGLIIPWCNQIRVLSSPAVGGFVTHCGWNSTLESMWCGVPMICYPLAYDQPTNTKLVVDDWGIGIRLCEHGGIPERNEVGTRFKDFMCGPIGKGPREEAGKVKEKFRSALKVGGSSEKNFDKFISDLKEKIARPKENPCVSV